MTTLVSDQVRHALERGHTIDITTTGNKTGKPRRLEIVFHVIDGRIYISGMPRADRKRAWLRNLEADPNLTFHLKRSLDADLPATARVITDPDERRTISAWIVANAWRQQDLEAMTLHAPIIEITFADGVLDR